MSPSVWTAIVIVIVIVIMIMIMIMIVGIVVLALREEDPEALTEQAEIPRQGARTSAQVQDGR
jgi:hypothetical protein